MLDAILNYNFMQHALIAAILSSIICGIMGTIIVEKRMVSLSSGIAHASFGGIGAGYFFGIEPIIGGFIFAIITSLSVEGIRQRTNSNTGTIVSMFWAAGMAIGILFITLTPGYPPDMTSYLFGDILTVNKTYLILMAVLTAMIVLIVLLYFSYWKLYLFDEEYAKIMGINTKPFEIVLYILIALSVVTLIKVVGIILSMALLSIPPAISKLFSNKLEHIMILSGVIGLLLSTFGLAISYYLNIPSGASIILLAILIYFIALSIKYVMSKHEKSFQ